METPEAEAREKLCAAAHQLWLRGLTSGTRSTLAYELHRRRYLVTRDGSRRADLKPNDLMTVDLQGADLAGSRNHAARHWAPHRVAFEYSLRLNPDDLRTGQARNIKATLLATPPKLLAFATHAAAGGANGIKLRSHAPVPLIDPSDEPALLAAIKSYAVIVLPDLGVFATGPSIDRALSALEDAESAAELTLTLQHLSRP